MVNKRDTKDRELTEDDVELLQRQLKTKSNPIMKFIGYLVAWSIVLAIFLGCCAIIKLSWGVLF